MRPGPGPRIPSPSSLCSPDGYLYEREAILEYILHQKKEIARQMKVMNERRGHLTCHGFDAELMSRAPLGLFLAHFFPVVSRPTRSSGAPGGRSRKSCSGPRPRTRCGASWRRRQPSSAGPSTPSRPRPAREMAQVMGSRPAGE